MREKIFIIVIIVLFAFGCDKPVNEFTINYKNYIVQEGNGTARSFRSFLYAYSYYEFNNVWGQIEKEVDNQEITIPIQFTQYNQKYWYYDTLIKTTKLSDLNVSYRMYAHSIDMEYADTIVAYKFGDGDTLGNLNVLKFMLDTNGYIYAECEAVTNAGSYGLAITPYKYTPSRMATRFYPTTVKDSVHRDTVITDGVPVYGSTTYKKFSYFVLLDELEENLQVSIYAMNRANNIVVESKPIDIPSK